MIEHPNAKPDRFLLQIEDCEIERSTSAFKLVVERLQLNERIHGNERTHGVVTGANGSGKSTLFDAIAGLLRPTKGKILLKSEDVWRLNENQRCQLRRNTMSFMRQSFDLIDYLTVSEHLHLQTWTGRHPGFSQQHRDQILDRFDLTASSHRKVSQLSGGQRQRVATMMALCCPADLLLLDEPTSQMDSENVTLLIECLEEYPGSVLCITHDERLISWASHQWQVVSESRTLSRMEQVR